MFIRKTRITHQKTGQTYFNYQLVESYRTNCGPRQRILLNLGPNLNLDKQKLKILANRIEEIIKNIESFIEIEEEIEQLAQKYASKLLNQLSNTPSIPKKPAANPTFRTINMETIEQQEPRTVGCEHLLLNIASELKLQKKLKSLGFSAKQIAVSLSTIIGRATFPASERATYEWMKKRSGLTELIDYDLDKTVLGNLYTISDLLLSHKEELEKYLGQAQKNLHGLNNTLVLYDLTNTYFEGSVSDNKKASFGRSKEKRSDCLLVTLGLAVNEHGFIQRSSFLPGNISEPATLQAAIKSLDDSSLLKPIIVLDAGIATEENLQWLRNHGYQYIVSARQKAPSKEIEGNLEPTENETVKVAIVKSENTEERWLYCESEGKQKTASEMRKKFQERFEKDLEGLSRSLAKPKGRKKYLKVLERLGRLKEKHNRISGCYEVEVKPSEDGQKAIAIHWKVLEEKIEEKLNDHYFLRTNEMKATPKELWNIYNNIRVAEDAFRFMKSSLGMRPIYHRKERRIDGHLWITLLAYYLIKSCLHQLKQWGINSNWETVRNRLSTRMRVTLKAKTDKGSTMYYRSTTKAEPLQVEIYRALGISSQIMQAKEVIV